MEAKLLDIKKEQAIHEDLFAKYKKIGKALNVGNLLSHSIALACGGGALSALLSGGLPAVPFACTSVVAEGIGILLNLGSKVVDRKLKTHLGLAALARELESKIYKELMLDDGEIGGNEEFKIFLNLVDAYYARRDEIIEKNNVQVRSIVETKSL